MADEYDIGLDSSGDWPLFPQHITGTPLVLQRIAMRLANVLGEWILDASDGLDFARWLAEKPFDIQRAGAEVRLQIETTPGVLRVETFAAAFDETLRTAIFTGRVIIGEEQLDFQVAPAGVSSTLDQLNQTPLVLFFKSGNIVARF